jgi:valyl-tRNA synthetase
VITALARLEPAEIVVATELTPPGKAATLVAGGVTVYLPLAGLIDLEAERRRLQAELENIDRQIQRIEAALSNDAFTSKAPAHVVERERSRLAELQERRHQLVERSAELAE